MQWADGYPTSWEAEEHVSPELIALFQQQQPELFQERTSAEAAALATGWSQEYETQYSIGQGQQTNGFAASKQAVVATGQAAGAAPDVARTAVGV